MTRFTILRHRLGTGSNRDASRRVASGVEHWDWLFEPPAAANTADHRQEKLLTWSTDPLPLDRPTNRADGDGVTVPALRLPDHRNVYLDYEGELTGDRGTVSQIATGHYDTSRHDTSGPSPRIGLCSVLTVIKSPIWKPGTQIRIARLSIDSPGGESQDWEIRVCQEAI